MAIIGNIPYFQTNPYKLCSHIGFFRCLSSLSYCHFPLLGALARRIQDQSSAYICLQPDKCGSKLHAERFKSVSVAIPFGTWKPNTLGTRCPGTRTQNPWISIWISEHLVAAQGRPAHQQRSPQGRSEVHLTMQRPWHTWNLWKHESNATSMGRHATSLHPRPHGPRSPRLFESTKHCLDSFYVGRPGHQMRKRVNTMWTRFQLKLSKRCIRFMWPSKATLSTESVLCEIILIFSYIIYKYVSQYIQYIMWCVSCCYCIK